MTIEQFNALSALQLKEELFKCCGCTSWAEQLAARAPFASVEALKSESDKIWASSTKEDILEAFTHHPKIGDVESLGKKFASTSHWASGEQSGVNQAAQNVLIELKDLNDAYEKKFGYIFIVCATGKSAEEMLEILKQRMPNQLEDELKVAANEQNKITHIRLDKLFT